MRESFPVALAFDPGVVTLMVVVAFAVFPTDAPLLTVPIVTWNDTVWNESHPVSLLELESLTLTAM